MKSVLKGTGFLILTGLLAMGCDSEGDGDGDSPDSGIVEEAEYPDGPYGFHPSLSWDVDAGAGVWTDEGDIIPNVCLNNALDDEVCFADFYRSDYDLLLLDFTMAWCSPCASAATSKDELIAFLDDNGWKATWITILENDLDAEAPALEDAEWWSEYYDCDPEKVLYDPQMEWIDPVMEESPGYPSVFMVHPSNMLIWNLIAGWPNPYSPDWQDFLDQWLYYLDYYLDQPGAVAD